MTWLLFAALSSAHCFLFRMLNCSSLLSYHTAQRFGSATRSLFLVFTFHIHQSRVNKRHDLCTPTAASSHEFLCTIHLRKDITHAFRIHVMPPCPKPLNNPIENDVHVAFAPICVKWKRNISLDKHRRNSLSKMYVFKTAASSSSKILLLLQEMFNG